MFLLYPPQGLNIVEGGGGGSTRGTPFVQRGGGPHGDALPPSNKNPTKSLEIFEVLHPKLALNISKTSRKTFADT